MKDFDASIRSRIQNEQMRLNPQAEERFEMALDKARSSKAIPKKKNHWVLALAAACVLVPVLLMYLMLPSRDTVRGGIMLPMERGEFRPLAQGEAKPHVRLDLHCEDGLCTVGGSMRNDTDEIWLIHWQAGGTDEWIWLEPGAFCDVFASWAHQGGAERLQYRGYRVTADVLHWMDGDEKQPGEEGYEEQQLLIEDAFENGALVLSPGDWPNGQAGEMKLVLPESYIQSHPGAEALEIYLQSGDLTDGELAGEKQVAGERVISPTTGMLVKQTFMPVAVSISVNERVQTCGLQHADVIYESFISSASTRMTAVFHDALGNGEIIAGPVRSVRSTQMSLSNEWGAALVYNASTGGSIAAAPGLRELPQPNIGLAEHWQYRVRLEKEKDRNVKAPDVFAADVSAIHADYARRETAVEGFRFGVSRGGEKTEKFTIPFTKNREVSFLYRDGVYESSISTYIYKKGTEQKNLSFENVIVQEVVYESVGGNEWVLGAALTGEGRALVHTAGRCIQGRWVRASTHNQPCCE